MKPYYVTNAITYPNAAPHLGHAYEYISSDVIARFKRLDGFDVCYLTGTDEHGLKMAQAAAAEGLPTTGPTPTSSDPRCAATRSSASFPAGCVICPSREPRSTGVCRCPGIPIT